MLGWSDLQWVKPEEVFYFLILPCFVQYLAAAFNFRLLLSTFFVVTSSPFKILHQETDWFSGNTIMFFTPAFFISYFISL